MITGYRPEFFQLFELVPKDVFLDYPADYLWMQFDPLILVSADRLRKRYGPMRVNTWFWGGRFEYRGWRPSWCNVGAELSMHRVAKAIDFEPENVEAEEIRKDMQRRPHDPAFEYINRVEDDKTWLHADRANIEKQDGRIVFFRG